MRLHFHPHGGVPKPCPHMKTLLSRLADNTLRGLARWYAAQHVKGCPGCAAGLAALRALRDRLRALAARHGGGAAADATGLTAERRAAVLRAWADAERRQQAPGAENR